MLQKIKAIKVKNISKIETDEGFLKILKKHPKYCEIEYDPILKRADGSLITDLPEGAEVLLIADFILSKIKKIKFKKRFLQDLRLGLIFLPEDTKLAERKAYQLRTQFQIENEIDRLNAEEGWVPNWSTGGMDKYVLFLENGKVGTGYTVYCRRGIQYMSQKTADSILAKYTQDELKKYLQIV